VLARSEQITKKEKGREMPKTGGKRRPLVRTQKAAKIRPSAPLLETRARSILSAMVTEVSAEPTDLQLPELPPVVEAALAAKRLPGESSLDDLPTRDLAAIARQGASLELDGAKHDAAALVSIAKNVKDDAHLKIINSGRFTADELGCIVRSAPGQVILG
jgi:hypothetical protein